MEECERYGHLAANQVGYNIFDQRMEAHVLPYCLKNGIGFMAYGTLGYGLLTGALKPDTVFEETDWRSKGKAFGLPLFERDSFLRELRCVEGLKAFAAKSGKTVAQLAISWVLSHPAASVALVGVRTRKELEENAAAAGWKLTAEERAEVNAILAKEGVPTYTDEPQAV